MPEPSSPRRRLLALLALLPAACATTGGSPPPEPRRPARVSTRPAAAPRPAVEPLGATYRVVRRANLRRGPSTRDPVLAVLPVGAELQATGRVAVGEWLRVRHGRTEGFVRAALVEAATTGSGGDEAALPAEPAATAEEAAP